MHLKSIITSLLLVIIIQTNFAQTILSGKVIDIENEHPIPNVTVIEQNSNTTFYTDALGEFSIKIPFNKGVLIFVKEHYTIQKIEFDGSKNLGSIRLSLTSIHLAEIELNIKNEQVRKTNFFAQHLPIQRFKKNTLQNDFITGFKNIPSLYTSSQGGGMGDGKLILRGFSPSETQIYINDIQINDMETGWVYWSNWSNLNDIAKKINLYSGLYSENSNISSIGGNIEIETYKRENKDYDEFKTNIGSGLYIKNSFQHHIVDVKNNVDYTFAISRTSSDGVVKGTPFISNSYYFDIQKRFEKHTIKAFIFGAPQWHGQRSSYEYHMATLDDYLKYGTHYNYNFGRYDGKVFNWTENYFHKNLMQLKWGFQPNSQTSFDAFAYASFATGGGSYEAGNTSEGIFPADKRWRNSLNGEVMWDAIDSYNSGFSTQLSDGTYYQRNDQNSLYQYINSPYNAGITKIAFTNKHHWLGTKINFDKTFNQHWKTHIDYHYRYTFADNFDRLTDLLGSDGYRVFYDQNNMGKVYSQTYPVNINTAWNLVKNPNQYDKLHFHYQSKISLHSLSGKTNYQINNWEIFGQYNINWQQNQRKDFFNYLTSDPNKNSKTITQIGFMGLIGMKYANKNHLVSLLGGWMKKPNRFEQIFVNYKNDINNHLSNESAWSSELNYLYKYNKGFVSVNLYHTIWKNKYTAIAYQNSETNQTGTAYLDGVNQNHLGIETVVNQFWNEKWQTNFSFSFGKWEYEGMASGNAFDFSQNNIGNVVLNLDGIKVGNAAQLKSHLSVTYKPECQWEFSLLGNYYDYLYSNLNLNQNHNKAILLPSYFTADFYLKTQNIKAGKLNIHFEISIENLLNKRYIIESATNIETETTSENWQGINTANKVFFGKERSWNLGMSILF